MTMKELEKWLTLEIVGKYHQTIHSTLLRPPIAVWRDWEDKFLFELPRTVWLSGYRSCPLSRAPCNGVESIFSSSLLVGRDARRCRTNVGTAHGKIRSARHEPRVRPADERPLD